MLFIGPVPIDNHAGALTAGMGAHEIRMIDCEPAPVAQVDTERLFGVLVFEDLLDSSHVSSSQATGSVKFVVLLDVR